MVDLAAPFVWGSGGERLTPEQVERKRKVAELLAKQGGDYSPIQHWTQGAARVAQALVGGWEDRKASEAEKANAAEDRSLLAGLLGGMTGAPAAAASSPSAATADPSAAVTATPAALAPVFTSKEAQYGLPANYLAQTAKIESNFNPTAANPNSSARGLFQFVNGTAKDYGLENPMDPIASTDAAARLAADNKATLTRALGREPTAGELYLAHQQGGGGASRLLANPNARAIDIVGADAVRLNGGNANMTAGEFARRWTSKLAANEADMPALGAVPAEAQSAPAGFAVPPGEQPSPAMTAQTFNAIATGDQPLDPAFQAEGVAQPWMGTAIPPQAAQPPMVAQAPMPPPRPADLPAPGAVEAIGQMPPQAAPQPQMMPDLSNSPDGGMRQLQVISEQARQGQPQAPQAPMNPLERVTAAFTGGQARAPAAAQNPAVAAVAKAVAQNPGDPIVQALTSPYASESTKKVAMALLVKKIEGDNKAPIAVGKDQRLVDRNGRVILDRDRNASDVKRSLVPVYGTDAEGNTVLLQPGEDGTAPAMKLPPGVKVSNGIEKIDTGTEIILRDKRSGQVVGREVKNIAGAEAAKVEGKAAGEAKVDMPGAIAKAEESLATIEAIRNHPGRNQFGATGWGSQLPIIGDGAPGTKGRDFVGLVEQMKGKAFLEAFSQLKGGGAISEGEGAKATAAIARLDRAQSKEGFDAALKDLEDVIRGGIDRARAKGGVNAPAVQPKPVDTSKPGSFKFNPATGKMEPM